MLSSALDDPIRLPSPPPETPRPGFPLWAAIVPVAGAVVLWQVTGSPMALWFAALGPLIAVATALDAARGRRRARRSAAELTAAGHRAARAEIDRRHENERRTRWRATPDVHRLLADDHGIWRRDPRSADVIVIGSGEVASSVRVEGAGDGDADGDAVRQRAALLDDAPVTVPLTAGVAVVGPQRAVSAVCRALAAQVCLALPPGEVRIDGEAAAGGDASGESWLRRLPHADATRGRRLWLGDGGTPVPDDAEVPIVRVGAGVPPPRCAAVLRLSDADTATLEYAGTVVALRPAVLGMARAEHVADVLRERGVAVSGPAAAAPSFADMWASGVPGVRTAARDGAGLPAPIGGERGGLAVVDLVEDGPHAVVVGVTGSGKSELLTTWVASMARSFPVEAVNFLLVDFKGGRTFEALMPLPHVVGVVTDLDDESTRRAIESLTAEVLHRERVLAEHRARDVGELAGRGPGILARLVIVVDEYAALTAAHPAFHDVFADIAARGRALGLHLILATQRAAGFRDAVLANAPLRVALRVTDPADSRAVIGCADAAALPGGVADRGSALVRCAADTEPRAVRVARCPPETVASIATAARTASSAAPRRPWLPPLPGRLPLAAVRDPGRIVLGRADEPDRQRQRVVHLDGDAPGLAVLGRAGSGRSSLLRLIAVQVPPERLHVVPADLEAAWDAVADLATAHAGDVVVVDDVDLLVARFPPDYAAVAAERLERCGREARSRGVRLVIAAQRMTAPVGRIADQLGARAILATTGRADRVAFGGEAAHHDPRMPAGRGRLDGTLVQFADPGEEGVDERTSVPPVWIPRHPTAFVAPAAASTTSTLEAWRTRGIETVALHTPGRGDPAALAAGRVVWGTPEEWTGRWRALAAGIPDAHLVIDAACGADVRLLTGRRELPPFASPGTGRAWVFDPEGEVVRVTLPRTARDADPRSRRLRATDARA